VFFNADSFHPAPGKWSRKFFFALVMEGCTNPPHSYRAVNEMSIQVGFAYVVRNAGLPVLGETLSENLWVCHGIGGQRWKTLLKNKARRILSAFSAD
jgi:hypothetical protein